MVSPMSSASGYVSYINYVAGTNKGGVKQDDLFNNPFGLGDVKDSADYTAAKVVETLGADTKLMWTPVVSIVKAVAANGAVIDTTEWKVAADGTVTGTGVAEGVKVAYEYNNVEIPQNDIPTVKAVMKNIPLTAKARRIAIYYSQMAA